MGWYFGGINITSENGWKISTEYLADVEPDLKSQLSLICQRSYGPATGRLGVLL